MKYRPSGKPVGNMLENSDPTILLPELTLGNEPAILTNICSKEAYHNVIYTNEKLEKN